nr:retrovirus-related Pol polyprotein from transposon TNT 1-94 [Tanacetum cinerariifolium]
MNEDKGRMPNKIELTLKQSQQGVSDDVLNDVNELRAKRIARTANPLALVAQQQLVYHPQNHPTHYTQNSLTKSQQAATRNRGKAIVNSPPLIYDQEPSMVAEDDEIRANQDKSLRISRSAGYDNQRLGNVIGARETVGTMVVQKSGIQCYNCKEFGHVARESQKPKRAKNASYHKEKMLLYKQKEAGIQLNAEQADWRDDTNDESEDQEVEAHICTWHKFRREHIEQNDDDDLANERELLASLIKKLKCEIDNSKNRNKFLETSNKVLFDKLKELDKRNDVKYASKMEIDCAKAKWDLISYKLESQNSFNKYTQTINDLNQTISKMKKELSAHQETISILAQAKEAQIKLYKTHEDKELDKVIALENKFKVLDNIVYKTGQSVQTMNMLNTPESDEVIHLEKESRSKLRDLIRPFDYEKLNDLYDLCVPQRKKSSEQRYFLERSRISHTPVNNGNSKESFNKQTTLLEKRMDESIPWDQKCKSSKELLKIKRSVGLISVGVERVIPTTSVSRPQLKSNPIEDKVMLSNSQGKKQDVEDHRRNVTFCKNKTSVTACNDSLKAKTSNVNFVCATCGKYVLNVKHDMCFLQNLNGMNSRTKMPIAVPVSTREPKRTVKQSVAKPLRKIVASKSNLKLRNTTRKLYEHVCKTCSWWYPKFILPGYNWKPKSQIGNVYPNEIILFIIDSRCSKHMTGNLKLLINFVEKFLGTVKFGNDQIAPILGYGDLVQGDVMIKRVYYVEGLNHNLFSVGQFYDADLEVAFWKYICYILDLKGNDLLTGSRGTNLYSITLQDTTSPNPICLMAKATSSQTWLWHRRLSHLNFDTINLLSKNYIVIGLPKLKFVKDHLCSS